MIEMIRLLPNSVICNIKYRFSDIRFDFESFNKDVFFYYLRDYDYRTLYDLFKNRIEWV